MAYFREERLRASDLPASGIFLKLLQLQIFDKLRCHILGQHVLKPSLIIHVITCPSVYFSISPCIPLGQESRPPALHPQDLALSCMYQGLSK